MDWNFDEVIDRKNNPYSYSIKWSKSQQIADAFGLDAITDDVISLFIADMDFRCAPSIREAVCHVAEHGIYGYSSVEGHPEYYNSIIQWFKRRSNWDIKREEIVYVNGTVEALEQIIKAFTNKGDGVIIQRPVYAPFTSAIESTGRTVVDNPLRELGEGGYALDLEDLAQKAKDPNNKLLLLCNPHNPVGHIWGDEELKELAEICRKNGVLIAADEIHGDLIRRGATFHPLATLADTSNIITATAANKTFNIAGLSCTNLVIPDEALRTKLCGSMGYLVPSPFSIAATIGAYTGGEEWLDALRDYLDGTIDWAIGFLHERLPKVKCRKPDGTYMLWMDFRAYGMDPLEIRKKIYKEAKVLLEYGQMFDPVRGAGFERMCIPSPRSLVQQAFERIWVQFEGN